MYWWRPGSQLLRCSVSSKRSTPFLLMRTVVRVLENSRTIMTNGIPELEVPPIDPIQLDLVEFRIFNLTTQFKDLSMRGLKDFKLLKSEVNKDDKYPGGFSVWNVINSNLDYGRWSSPCPELILWELTECPGPFLPTWTWVSPQGRGGQISCHLTLSYTSPSQVLSGQSLLDLRNDIRGGGGQGPGNFPQEKIFHSQHHLTRSQTWTWVWSWMT